MLLLLLLLLTLLLVLNPAIPRSLKNFEYYLYLIKLLAIRNTTRYNTPMQSSPNTYVKPLRRLNYRTSRSSNSSQPQKRIPARPRVVSSSHLSKSWVNTANPSANKAKIDSFCPYGRLNYGSASSNGGTITGSSLKNYGSGARIDCGKFVSTANLENSQSPRVTTDIRIQSKEESRRVKERRLMQFLVAGLAAFMLILTGAGMLWMHQSNAAVQSNDIVTTYSGDNIAIIDTAASTDD